MTSSRLVCPYCHAQHWRHEDDGSAVVVMSCGVCNTLFAQDANTGKTFEVEIKPTN